MAWERRQGTSRRYYTRSERIGGCVVRTYIGTEESARNMADAYAALADWGADLQREEQERRARWKWIVAAMTANAQATVPYIEAFLIAAGYHRHNRQWRKRRGMNTSMSTASQPTSTTPASAPTVDEVRALAK